MDSSSSASLLLLIIFISILLSAFFSASETALISLNRYKLRTAVMQKRYGAASADKLLQAPEKLITLILICNNIVNIGSSALTTIVAESLFGEMGIAIATGILTFVILLFCEIVPKTLASQQPEKVAFMLSPILVVFANVTRPLVYIFNLLTKLVFKLLRIKTDNNGSTLSSEELRVIVKESQQLVGKEHSEMMSSILDLEEVYVEDVMVPRHEIPSIDIDDDLKSIIRQLNHATTGHIVVYRESMDKHLVGILRIKEAYRLMLDTNEYTKETLVRAIDQAYFIPEGTNLTRQLLNFKKNKRRLGLVVDEYGYIIGLVTIDDILEEIVGNFTINSTIDEEEDISLLSTGKYLISGQANLRDLNKKFGWNLVSEEARTLNGYLLEIFQDIPKVGTVHQIDNLDFLIKTVNRTGISEVEIIDTKRYKPSDKKVNKTSKQVGGKDLVASKDSSNASRIATDPASNEVTSDNEVASDSMAKTTRCNDCCKKQ